MRKRILRILFFLVLIAVLLIVGAVSYLELGFPKDGKVVAVTIDKNDTALVARGKYLANALAGCVDCHSPRNFNYFGMPPLLDSMGKGGLLFNHALGFPGTIYARNITPAGIGSWTDAQVYHTVTTGVTPDGRVLFPVMPYPHFGKADPEDIKAMIAYVRTFKPIEATYPDHKIDFPVSLFIRQAPAPAQPEKRPLPSDSVAYGKYLVSLASCEDCHTRKEKGQPVPGMDMAGGFAFHLSGMGTVRSSNITPDDETGIGNWTETFFINAFKFFDNPANQQIPWQKRGYQTVMPWISHSQLSRSDLASIYQYLRTLKPVKNKVVKWTPESDLGRGNN